MNRREEFLRLYCASLEGFSSLQFMYDNVSYEDTADTAYKQAEAALYLLEERGIPKKKSKDFG